jgi:autotransporter-associated beta strand protein
VVVFGLAGPDSAAAADNTWTNTGGNFAWDTTTGNWTSPLIWNNSYANADSAIFGATGVGTITVSPSIVASTLNFTAGGYTLTGGSITLSQYGNGTLAPGQINVGGTGSTISATTATINSNIVSPMQGLNKTGDGVLVLGGSANSITGFTPLGGSGWGANVLIGSATASTFGGSLRLGSATALPATTTVAVGNGFLDIQAFNVTLAGLTFANTKPNLAFSGTPDQGVIGTGTLTVTGSIRSVGNSVTGYANYINVPVSGGGGTLRLEVGSAGNLARDVMFLQPVSNGSVFKTGGANTSGAFGFGGIALLANNTYTGATTINGGITGSINIFAGTNASTSLSVVNALLSLQSTGGGFGSAATVLLTSGATLSLNNATNESNTSAGAGNTPPIPAADVVNRVNTAATVTVDGSTVALVGSANAPINQTLASINLANGFSRFNFTAGTGQSANLTVTGNLTLAAGATVVLSGAGLQTTAAAAAGANNFVVNGTVPAAVNGIIPGVYGTTTVGGNPTDFARYSSTAGVGFVLLAAGDYANDTFGATNSVNLTVVTTVSTNSAANAIKTGSNVTINGGQTLTVGAGGILTTAAVTVAGPGTLAFGSNPGLLFNNTTTTTYSGPISGTAGLVRSGAGAVTLSGDLSGLSGTITNEGVGVLNLNTATFAGPLNILGGTVTTTANIGTGGTATLGTTTTPAGTVGQIALLNINTAAIPTFARNIVTVGSNGAAPFAGVAGLQLTTLGTATQTISGTITLGTHLTINASGTADTIFSGVISGAGGLNVMGGVVRLTNAGNTFAGGLQFNGGTTAASADAALGTGPLRFVGGTLRTDYAGTLNRNITVLTSATLNTNGNNITSTGTLSAETPSATFTKIGAGTLTLSSASPSFPGAVVVSGGQLTLTGAAALPTATAISPDAGGQFRLDNSGTNNTNRIADQADLQMTGGEFYFLGNGSAASSETIGRLSLFSGSSTITVQPGSGQSAVLTFGGFNFVGGGILFRGTGLSGTGADTSRIFLTGQPAGFIPNSSFDASITGTGTSLAVYDPTVGVRAPVTGDFYTNATHVIQNMGGPNTPTTANVLIDNSPAWTTGAAADSNTVASLTVAPGGALTVSHTLTLTSGIVAQNAGGSGTITGGTLALVSATGAFLTVGDLAVASVISGTGGVTKSGAGTLTLTGANTFTGGLGVDSGTLNLNAGGSIANGNSLALGPGATLNLNNAATTTVSGTSGTGTINIAAASTLAFTAAAISTANLAGSGGITFNPAAAAQLTFSGSSAAYTGTITGNANARYLLNTPTGFGSGTVNAAAQNLNTGHDVPTVGFNFGPAGTGTVATNFVLTSTTGVDVYFIASTATGQTITLTGLISGGVAGSSFVWDETGSSQSNTLVLANTGNTFAGTVRVDFGTLAITSNGALGNPANALILNSNSPPQGSLRFEANNINVARTVTVSGLAAINTNGNTATISGVLAGLSDLTKTGSGTLILSNAANTHTGAVTVAAGTLLVNGNMAGAATPPTLTVNSGATLGGTGTIGAAGTTRTVTINSGGTLAPGTANPGLLTVTGPVSFATGSTFTVRLNGATVGTQYDRLVVVGDVTLGGTTLSAAVGGGFTPSGSTQLFLIDNQGANPIGGTFNGIVQNGTVSLAGGYTAKVSYTGDTATNSLTGGNDVVVYNFVPVPEPATAFGFAVAGMAAASILRRRYRPAAA